MIVLYTAHVSFTISCERDLWWLLFWRSGYRRLANPDYVVGGTIAACVGVYLFKESAQKGV